jgi:hypothetical protein
VGFGVLAYNLHKIGAHLLQESPMTEAVTTKTSEVVRQLFFVFSFHALLGC